MSSKDPLLKELKGYAAKLITECPKPITDDEPKLIQFCECFEKILTRGLLPHKTVIAVIFISDCWFWLERLGTENWSISYNYSSCVEDVRNCQRLQTNRGRVRLLIRYCLVKKCLHEPIDFIVREGRCCLLYSPDSVLGDTILASVLVSLLRCLSSSITFALDLSNTSFLDSTWQLPLMTSITFVPTKTLGLSVAFVNGRAVICRVVENSVAEENGMIHVGDILDTVNGVFINGRTQGGLSHLLKKSAKLPISVLIIKALRYGQLFGPIIPLLRQAGLDPALICLNEPLKELTKPEENGIVYLGSVGTGCRGDVKQIQVAINNLQSDQSIPVTIECHNLGIRVISTETKEVLIERNYMEISSCGCSTTSLIYFGFIAGDKSFIECQNFVCYIFSSRNQLLVDSLLKTIGQGFRRTLYTV